MSCKVLTKGLYRTLLSHQLLAGELARHLTNAQSRHVLGITEPSQRICVQETWSQSDFCVCTGSGPSGAVFLIRPGYQSG